MTGSFQGSWSSEAFGPDAPAVMWEIARTLHHAHRKMVDAHTAGELETLHLYGHINRKVLEELPRRLKDLGGVRAVPVRGYRFVIVRGWLLYPVRCGEKYVEARKLKLPPPVSKTRRLVFQEFGPEPLQPALSPELDLLAPEEDEPPSLPEVLEALKGEVLIATIAYTSNLNAGIIQAYCGQAELLAGTRDLRWHGIQPIDLNAPGDEGESGGPSVPLQGTPPEDGPRFGQGAEPELPFQPKPRHTPPITEPEGPRPNIQNDD